MRHYETSFFCNEGEGPVVSSTVSRGYSWPIVLKIQGTSGYPPAITLHIASIEDLRIFKDSVVADYESALAANAEQSEIEEGT